MRIFNAIILAIALVACAALATVVVQGAQPAGRGVGAHVETIAMRSADIAQRDRDWAAARATRRAAATPAPGPRSTPAAL